MAVWNIIALSDIRSGFRIDSEFYKSEYISKDHELSKLKTYALGHLAKVTDGEHGSVLFIQNGVKYLTAEHIKQGYIDADSARFVSEEVDRRNARASVSTGDVLISIKGTLGEVGLAEASLLPANMNRDVAIIKLFPNSPSSEYITVFLRSRFGEYQLAREGSGGVQQMITLERLRNIRIPIIAGNSEDEVSRLYQTGLKKRQESIDLYSQALQLLESELGLVKLSFQKPMAYTTTFSELELSRRADAEFFKPEYQAISALIKTKAHTYLGRLFSIKRGIGIDPKAYSDNCGLPYIRIKELSLTNPLLPENSVKIPPEKLPLNYPKAAKGDYILAVIGATIGKINLIDKSMEGSLYSNNTACLSAKIELMYPNAFELILRSEMVQSQIQQRMAKTAQEKISDPELKRILIPELDSGLLSEIEELCCKSKESFFLSKQLLEQAKTRVEQLIEEAVQA